MPLADLKAVRPRIGLTNQARCHVIYWRTCRNRASAKSGLGIDVCKVPGSQTDGAYGRRALVHMKATYLSENAMSRSHNDHDSRSIVTATSPFAERRTVLPSTVGHETSVDIVVMTFVTTLATVSLGQLDAVVFDSIYGADMDAVRANNFHMLFDAFHISHKGILLLQRTKSGKTGVAF